MRHQVHFFPYFYYICLAYTESRYETNTQPILVGYMDRPAPSANIHHEHTRTTPLPDSALFGQ